MADSVYGQQMTEHDASSDEQHFQLHSDALHNASPPTLSFNQNGLPSPFTWEQGYTDYTDYIHSSANLITPTYGSAPLYHETGNENAALTHDADYRDGSAAQRSFPGSYDLPSTLEELGSNSLVDLLAIATSGADGQGIDRQPQAPAPAPTHHLPALSMHDPLLVSGPVVGGSTLHFVSDVGYNAQWQSLGHSDAAAGFASHPESAPSASSAGDTAYNMETSLYSNPMSNVLNTLGVASADPGSPIDMLLMSESTGNALNLETQPSSLSMDAMKFVFGFQLPGEAVSAAFNSPPATVPTRAFNAQNTPDVNDEPRAPSTAFTQGSSGPSKKRSRSDDDDGSQSPRPSVPLPAGKQRIPCKWQQVFGGGCVGTFCGPQQHDRHVLSHLPDTDGTVFFSYMCKKCPPNKDEETMRAAIKRWRRKEERGFSREDSCQRHVKTKHAEEVKGGDPKVHVLEVPRPWWWPSELLMTERYQGKEIGRKPEGEARTWRAYFQDIIDKYPEVLKKPKLPRLDDENKNAEHTRPVKRRRTRKSTTS